MIRAENDAKLAATACCPVCRSTVNETVIRRIEIPEANPYILSQVRRDCTACHWVDVVERHTPLVLA